MYFEEENYFDNKFLEDASTGLNNPLAQELGQVDYYDFCYSQADIYDDKENNDERYMVLKNGNQIDFNENININDKKSKTEKIKYDAKTGSTGPDTKNTKVGLIFQIAKEMKQNIVGRKRKNDKGGKHNKFSYDNVTRKLKTKLFESILSFLNSSLVPVQIENPKKYSKKILYSKPFFLKINQEIIKDINVDNNKKLLKSTLKEIFSNDVSKKVENYGLDYNRKLIEKIYEENIQKKTIGILDRTLLECLEQFRGTKKYEELQGLEKEYNNVIEGMKKNEESDEYIEIFKDLVSRFEEYYENKKSRPKSKNNNENNENEDN